MIKIIISMMAVALSLSAVEIYKRKSVPKTIEEFMCIKINTQFISLFVIKNTVIVHMRCKLHSHIMTRRMNDVLPHFQKWVQMSVHREITAY